MLAIIFLRKGFKGHCFVIYLLSIIYSGNNPVKKKIGSFP